MLRSGNVFARVSTKWSIFPPVSSILIAAHCVVEGQVRGTGTAANRHVAKDIAANQALRDLVDAAWS